MTSTAAIAEHESPTEPSDGEQPQKIKRFTDDVTGKRWYTYPPTNKEFVSCTTVISASEDASFFLAPWYAKLAAKFVVENLEQVAVWMEIGDDDPKAQAKYAKMTPEAAEAAKAEYAQTRIKRAVKALAEVKADAGSYVHDVADALVKWAQSPAGTGAHIVLPELPEHLKGALYDDEPIEDVVEAMIDGFINFVSDFNPDIQASEMVVFNTEHEFAGTLDSIMRLKDLALALNGKTFAAPGETLDSMVDIKSGKNVKMSWKDQVEGYRRCNQAWISPGVLVPMPRTEAGAVLHLRPHYRRGYRLMFVPPAESQKAWNRLRNRLKLWRDTQGESPYVGPVAYPLREDGTIQPPYLADLDAGGYGRPRTALMNAKGLGIETIEDVSLLTRAECLEVSYVGEKTIHNVAQMLLDNGYTFAGETREEMLADLDAAAKAAALGEDGPTLVGQHVAEAVA